MANDFTKGIWEACPKEPQLVWVKVKGKKLHHDVLYMGEYPDAPELQAQQEANKSLIVTAGNTATALASMDLDAEKVFERLPEIVASIRCHETDHYISEELLNTIKACEVSDDQAG